MDVIMDLLESRLDRLPVQSKNSQIGLHMKSWQPSQFVVALQFEFSPLESPPLLIISIIPKQNKSARVSIV